MAVSISRQLVDAARRHLVEDVPLGDMNLGMADRNRIERVKYVRFLSEKEPGLDVFAKLRRLAAGRYENTIEEWREAKKDMMLFEQLLEGNGKTEK